MSNSIFERVARLIRAEMEALNFDQQAKDFSSEAFFDTDTNARSQFHSTAANGQDAKIAGYYANLELPYGADLQAIRKAWKRLLRKYHPDMHSNDPENVRIANQIVQGLNTAYKELEIYLSQKQ